MHSEQHSSSDVSQEPSIRSGGGRRRRQVTIGLIGVLGATAVVGGGYLLYAWALGVSMPDPATASPEQITRFLGHAKGLAALPVDERQAFMTRLLKACEDPARCDLLVSATRRMTVAEKEVCREALWDVGYSLFTQEAGAYHRTPERERATFIDRRVADYYLARDQLAGRVKGAKQGRSLFDSSWMTGLPTDRKGLIRLIMSKMDAADFDRNQAYFEALAARIAELKKHPEEKARLLKRYGPEGGGR